MPESRNFVSNFVDSSGIVELPFLPKTFRLLDKWAKEASKAAK